MFLKLRHEYLPWIVVAYVVEDVGGVVVVCVVVVVVVGVIVGSSVNCIKA